MSSWSSSYLVAGLRLDIVSTVGDVCSFLPSAMRDFAAPRQGSADITISFLADEEAQADPLRRFFPSQFNMESVAAGLSFDGREGKRKRLGFIHAGCAEAEMGLPPLERPWRIADEEEAVREAVQAFVRACLQCRLMEAGGTLMHAAGVDWEGSGFAFTGHTRAGKTTLSRDFPAEAVLGDDLVAVGRTPDEIVLFGTPWPGREGGTVAYGGVPLRAVFHLHPELDPGLHPQSAGEALAELATNAPRLGYEGEESKLLGIFSSLVTAVPIYKLSLRLGDDVMPFLWHFVEGGRER
ncbi:MAG: hypothetical protein JW854_08335 [Actinobacteria bacterium]|nr:hypothetical protein [Actinomycetota bacterium]